MNRIVEADFLTPMVEVPNEKPRILIVDNNRDFTLSAKLTLQRTGRYVVCEENDGSRTRQTARSFRPDLILLDIAMAEASSGYRIQGHHVLAKPVSVPDLIRVIEENLPGCAAA